MPQSPVGRVHHQQVHTSRTGIPPGWLLELARLNRRSWVVWLSDLSRYWHILLQQGTGRSRSNWRICCQKRRQKCTIKKNCGCYVLLQGHQGLQRFSERKKPVDWPIKPSCDRLTNMAKHFPVLRKTAEGDDHGKVISTKRSSVFRYFVQFFSRPTPLPTAIN